MKLYERDVLVIGGGTAGLVAGISAARAGASTLIIEGSGNLGGNAAVGMTMGGFFDKDGHQVVRGIPHEFVIRAQELCGGLGYIHIDSQDTWISRLASIDPEVFKYIAVEKVREADCDVWLRTTFVGILREDSRITGVRVINKSGLLDVRARVVIDATGDGDVASASGVCFERGGGNEQQLISTMFRVGNINTDSLERYMQEVINVDNKDPWQIETAPLRASFEYWLPWKFESDLLDLPHLFGVYFHGNQGDIVINSVGIVADALDTENLSWAEMELRKKSTELFWYLRDHIPGFESAYLSHVYPVGVRESRRILGEYTITLEDIISGRKFSDVIAMGAYPPDLHSSSGHVYINRHENRAYQIPYRSTLPEGVDGILVVGRCISATFEAQSGLRGIGPSMSTGEAIGLAAALATQHGEDPRNISIKKLQKALIAQGAYLGEEFENES